MTPAAPVGDDVACEDCGAPYGKDGWCDVVVPDDIWNQLGADLLCFRCMTKRIQAHGIADVPVIVASGPYTDANERWRMEGWDHGHKVGLAAIQPVAWPDHIGNANELIAEATRCADKLSFTRSRELDREAAKVLFALTAHIRAMYDAVAMRSKP